MSEPTLSPRQSPTSVDGPAVEGENFFRSVAEEIGVDFHQFQVLKKSNPAEARLCFARFKVALTRRMQWEDETLFPQFESKLGVHAANISARFRAEHGQIRDLLDAIELKLEHQNSETDSEEATLQVVLGTHNHWEHEAVYGVCQL